MLAERFLGPASLFFRWVRWRLGTVVALALPVHRRIYSNGGTRDYVINPLRELAGNSARACLAAPYFTALGSEIVNDLIRDGKQVQLLVGLNAATSPGALDDLPHESPELAVRFLTRRFHAKVFLFDDTAVVGSSNLTSGGLLSNREAVVCLDRPEDADAVDEIRALFAELWDAGSVLTPEVVRSFAEVHRTLPTSSDDLDESVEEAVGKVEPPNVDVDSRSRPKRRLFLEGLRRDVYEQYRPAFTEVAMVLEGHELRRGELGHLGLAHETNRFLNYVRLVHAVGDDAWQSAPLRPAGERREMVVRLGHDWVDATDNKVPPDYADRLTDAHRVFGQQEALRSSTKAELTEGLMSLHAFTEQLRFVKGGWDQLPAVFWARNDNDTERVKLELFNLLYGPGDFIDRLHDLLYARGAPLVLFGRFCALELYGTINPDQFPPMNGRMAKALRYLGFDVKGA